MPEIGTVVNGRYRVLRELGRGGMGIVYLALDGQTDTTWAIKVIDKEMAEDFDLIKQLLTAETAGLEKLSHRCLPDVREIIETEDSVMVIMEYIEGSSLKKILQDSMQRDGRPLAVEDVVIWGRQLCEVLHYLHTGECPMIYGDLKPANVMMKPDGQVVLIDLGAIRPYTCRDREKWHCLGTPGFAAPEQYGNSSELGPWTDIYSLGATLHNLLTGRDPDRTPFCYPNILECYPEHYSEISDGQKKMLAAINDIIEKCTRFVAKERYQSCEELAAELAAVGKIPDENAGNFRQLRHFRWKTLIRAGLGAVAAVSLIILCGIFMTGHVRNSTYDSCIERAVSAGDEEKIDLLKKAVFLNPQRDRAYIELLDELITDNDFSDSDKKLMTELLYGGHGKKDNRTCLQENETGYVIFSYKLGMAYYFLAGDAGDRICAGGWLNNVVHADMEQLNLAEYDSRKWIWQMRADILNRFSGYYGARLKQVKDSAEMILSWEEYWEDMNVLIDNLLLDESLMIELRICQEVVMGLFENASDLKEAGVEKGQIREVLDEILLLISDVTQEEREEELKENIRHAVEKTIRNIEVVYDGAGGEGL